MLPMPRLPKTEKGKRIAFYGPMCSGKTYCADYLVGVYNYTKISFATPLKTIAYTYFGLMDKSGSSRRVLQKIGQQFREYDNEVWIKALLRSAEKTSEELWSQRIVVDDLRYLNEAKALKRNGFLLVYVQCPPDERFKRIKMLYPDTREEELNHQSESEYLMIKPDFTVSGEGLDTITDLESLISEILDGQPS